MNKPPISAGLPREIKKMYNIFTQNKIKASKQERESVNSPNKASIKLRNKLGISILKIG
jgi:hypothetical protein